MQCLVNCISLYSGGSISSSECSDWSSDLEHAGLRAGRGIGACAGRGCWGALRCGGGGCAGGCGAPGADGGAGCCGPGWGGGGPDVPVRGVGGRGQGGGGGLCRAR